MLQITIPSVEMWDENKNEFVYTKSKTLCLEHSLVSISKWESKWHKPFLSQQAKTEDETIDYIRCMTVSQNVDPEIYLHLSNENITEVKKYIEDSMTATWFTNDDKPKRSREQVTSELIYYWMIALNIPFECRKWHLNRLLTLIKVCSIKNKPPKKMSRKEIMSRNASLNSARRKKHKSKG